MSLPQSAANRTALLLLVVAALVAAGYALQHTLSCFLLSFVLAYLIDPLVVALERRRVKRMHGITLIYLLLVLCSLIFVTFFVPMISRNWDAFVHSLPLYLQKAEDMLLSWKERILLPYSADEWRWVLDTLTSQLDKLFGKAGAGIYTALSSAIFNLFNIILAPILVLFMLMYKEPVIAGITSWLPPARRDTILAMGREINGSIGGYLRGQLIVSLIVAIFSTVALFLLDVDHPIFNGVFAGLASILPFIGVILATLPPLFFAYIKFQSGIALFKVLVAFSVIYFLEGYVVKPVVFKGAMDLNPLVTIIFVMAFGELMGFWGILLAIPIAAAVKILAEHIRRGEFADGA
jgi:putative permease